jgi:hypothetical protein
VGLPAGRRPLPSARRAQGSARTRCRAGHAETPCRQRSKPPKHSFFNTTFAIAELHTVPLLSHPKAGWPPQKAGLAPRSVTTMHLLPQARPPAQLFAFLTHTLHVVVWGRLRSKAVSQKTGRTLVSPAAAGHVVCAHTLCVQAADRCVQAPMHSQGSSLQHSYV